MSTKGRQFPFQPGEFSIPFTITKKEDLDGPIESICGGSDDTLDIANYDGSLGVTIEFVQTHQSPVGQIQWNNNLRSIYTQPGNVQNLRWTSGTLISDDLFITAGHSFDTLAGGYRVPRKNDTNDPIDPPEIAKNMHINFNYQFDDQGQILQTQSFN